MSSYLLNRNGNISDAYLQTTSTNVLAGTHNIKLQSPN
jgi:hypothetical protein